jgi:5-methylcytosine-specific restriction endonuclease McrA
VTAGDPAWAQHEGGPGPARSLRERVLLRDGFRCVYCGEEFPDAQLTLDHVEPRLRGGDRSEGNLVSACRACNTAKGSTPAWAYLAAREPERENFLRYATAVWPRLRRAVQEAAGHARRRRSR